MALAGVHMSGTTSPIASNEPSTSKLIDVDSLNTKLSENLLSVSNGTRDEVNEIIFNSHITQKPCDRLIEELDEDSCEEVHLLPQQTSSVSKTDVVSCFYILIS